jgi:predicted YcjX-like family ATPase
VKGIPVGRSKPTVLFPGELPESLADLAEPRHRFLRFEPPPGLGRDGRGFENARLDQALQFLIGDRLA